MGTTLSCLGGPVSSVVITRPRRSPETGVLSSFARQSKLLLLLRKMRALLCTHASVLVPALRGKVAVLCTRVQGSISAFTRRKHRDAVVCPPLVLVGAHSPCTQDFRVLLPGKRSTLVPCTCPSVLPFQLHDCIKGGCFLVFAVFQMHLMRHRVHGGETSGDVPLMYARMCLSYMT
jgi:hypothetical protein